MLKKLLLPLLFILILTFGCQNQLTSNASEDELYNDAKIIYEEIKNGENDVHDKIDNFSSRYIDHIDDYESQRKLLVEMDSLSWSYIMYYVSLGQEDEEAIKFHQESINESIAALDKEFNN